MTEQNENQGQGLLPGALPEVSSVSPPPPTYQSRVGEEPHNQPFHKVGSKRLCIVQESATLPIHCTVGRERALGAPCPTIPLTPMQNIARQASGLGFSAYLNGNAGARVHCLSRFCIGNKRHNLWIHILDGKNMEEAETRRRRENRTFDVLKEMGFLTLTANRTQMRLADMTLEKTLAT
eukprot:733140-Amphidinium_carterae.2